MDVVVGDIVRVDEGQLIPADVVPLCSSNEKGDVFIETANLDGESGDKLRNCVSETRHCQCDEKDLGALKGCVVTGPPTLLLENFEARYVTADEELVSLNENNILLRGAKLSNTEWVCALVVFTGEETKLVLNQQDSPSKFTHVERRLNKYLLGLFILILVLCLVSSTVGFIWEQHYFISVSYLSIPKDYNPALQWFILTLSFFVLYSLIIPISLYVSMEFVKLWGSLLLIRDESFKDEETGSGLVVKTSNLLEELGQVTHLFSDKTGTLTENRMEFKKCSINGRAYHCPLEEGDKDLLNKGESLLERSEISSFEHNFLLSMALNHYIIVKEIPGSEPQFSSTSPDEEALVEAARRYGYEFVQRDQKKLTLKINGKKEKFKLLAMIEFTSSRKRMSVIIQDGNGTIKLLCKGADNIIFERLADDKANRKLLNITQQHVDFYSTLGLRTLCYSERILDPEEFNEWKQIFDVAQNSIEERKEKVEIAASLIEKDLNLLGATAIEDKLQIWVPETLKSLLKANIKIWVLTGDKQQTAISIGKSCNLITPTTKLLKLNVENEDQCKSTIEKFEKEYQTYKNEDMALVVDGKSLSFAISLDNFVTFALHCSTVICCRVSPIQKAQVVAMVKKHNRDAVTLSIGDGANDVSMIQEADVGVGIRGREGSQASRSADFSIAKFHYLRDLLFIHGRYTYVRVAQLIQYSFYKNISFTILQFYFAIFSGFTGQTLFDSWVISVYNLFFTSWPILIFAIFEKDVPETKLQKYPELYNRTQNNSDFNIKTFCIWTMNAIWHSLVFFFGTLLLWDPVMSSDGTTYDIWGFGNMVVSIVVVTVTLRLAIDTLYWPWMMFVCSIGSIAIYFCFLFIYGEIKGLSNVDGYYLLFLTQSKSVSFWLILLILVIIAILPDICIKWLRLSLDPTDWQIIKEIVRKDKKNARKKQKANYGSVDQI
eukprot:TRINITY_DN20318_c0_g1_i1.p1 TRINITY_DN20318_c0_g1~~TRINITY_DN20318_c0_g1_i1.p1  ORF type:complete len:1088 (+),score=213.39 TRINITY_DN20318_c0_g1_i1:430-3264(+)